MKPIETGKIVNVHGIRGEVKAQPWCDDPEIFQTFPEVQIGQTVYPVQSARVTGTAVLLKLAGVDDRETAEHLRNRIVLADRSLFPLAEGFFFITDLIGLEVLDADSGQNYGTLTEVFQTGANDVYEITDLEGKKRYVPAIRNCIIRTSPEEGRMEIRPLEGLFDQ